MSRGIEEEVSIQESGFRMVGVELARSQMENKNFKSGEVDYDYE